MKSTKRHFKLESGEYLITGSEKESYDYKIFHKGKDVTKTTVAIIRRVK